jgi:hypothetical protein
MAVVNSLLKRLNKGDHEGRNGRPEIWMCGVLRETGVSKVIRKLQISSILQRSVEYASYDQFKLPRNLD